MSAPYCDRKCDVPSCPDECGKTSEEHVCGCTRHPKGYDEAERRKNLLVTLREQDFTRDSLEIHPEIREQL